MMTQERQKDDRDFKQKAVELSFARGNAREIAEEFKIRLPLCTIVFLLVTLLVSTNFGCKSREPVEKGGHYKWLPEGENYTSVATDVDDFLKSINGRMRLLYCDADSRGERGTHVTGWNELNGFLMALEIPGIYVQTDDNQFFVFDHVEAVIEKRGEYGVILKIINPTKFHATVSVFAESVKQAQNPLGYTAFMNWPKVKIKANDTLQIHISSNGSIIK